MAFRFRLLGFPVQVQLFFFITVFFIGPKGQGPLPMLLWIAAAFVGVLLHELGHAVVGNRLNLAPYIELHAFGGLTGWRTQRDLTPWQRIGISAAGPATGIAVGVALILVGRAVAPMLSDPAVIALRYLVWVNLGWGVLNLAPVLPLDGGNILSSLAETVAPVRGPRIARTVSILLTAALAVWAVSAGQWWLAILGGILTVINVQAWRYEGRRDAWRARVRTRRPELDRLGEAFNRRDWVEVEEAAEELLERADGDGDGNLRGHALYFLTWGRLMRGNVAAARQVYDRLPEDLPPHPGLDGALLLAEGRDDDALPHLRHAATRGTEDFVLERWAEAVVRTGSFADAATLVESPGEPRPGPKVLLALENGAYDAGAFAEAARFAALRFRRHRDPVAAYNAACCLARAGDPDGALQWLGRAIGAGFDDLEQLDGDPDLAPLRNSQQLRELRERMARGRGSTGR